MSAVLLSLHVLAGIIFVGPVTVATSLFPRYAREAMVPRRRDASVSVLRVLRRISTGYAIVGLSVPAFGIGVAIQLGVLTDAWLIVAMALTVLAALLLALVILPAQRGMLEALDDPGSPLGGASDTTPGTAVLDTWSVAVRRLAGQSGVFALLWAVVVVLMIVRPGSTTGV